MGVFIYVLQGKQEAIKHFEAILQKPGRPKENTLANLIFLHGEDTEQGIELRHQLESVQNDDSLAGKLEIARAMCERGYFCGFYIAEEVHNLDLATLSVNLLKTAIENGKVMGLSHNEVCIWQSYLFKANKDVFVNQVITENNTDEFSPTMTTFLEFYNDIEDEDNYYKSTCLMEVLSMFTIQRQEIEEHPNCARFYQEEETLKEIWDDVQSGCEEAIAMCPTNHRLYLKAARIHSRLSEFDKAQLYVDKSLEINRDLNLSAMHCQMTLYKNRAFLLAKEENDAFSATEWYHKAYDCGKEIEKRYDYVASAPLMDMNSICYSIAVDKTRQPWQLHRGKEMYLDEAIEYGERALKSLYHRKSPRVLSDLGQCYAMKHDYSKAAQYLGQACDTEKSGKVGNLMKYLRYLSETFHLYRQEDRVGEIATACEKAWEKHPREKVLEVWSNYGNNFVAKKNGLIKQVIEELHARNSEVLQEFCGAIVSKPCNALWLKDFCQRYL